MLVLEGSVEHQVITTAFPQDEVDAEEVARVVARRIIENMVEAGALKPKIRDFNMRYEVDLSKITLVS